MGRQASTPAANRRSMQLSEAGPTVCDHGEVGVNTSKMNKRLTGRRILCFYPWTPFEATGAWSRFQCMWQFFVDHGAAVTLAFLTKGTDAQLKNIEVRFPEDFSLVDAVWTFGQKIVANGPRAELRAMSQAELSILVMFEKSLYTEDTPTNEWLQEIVEQHDMVTCEYPMLLPALSPHCRKAQKPLLVTCLDALFELHGASQIGRETLRQKEVEALRLADRVVFCTEREQKLFEAYKIRGPVVLNTGDALALIPGKHDESKQAVVSALSLKTSHYVLFVGSGHGPNIEAVAEIKNIARQTPDVSFVIAGSCCAQSTDGNVFAVGRIDEALLDLVYRGASAIIVPLTRGTGMSIKTYQAFNYGKPVISTVIGARGFSVESGKELILVEKTSDFPVAIRQLLGNPELCERVGKRAREYAEELDYRKQFLPYAEIVEGLLGSSSTQSAQAAQTLLLVDNNLLNRVGHHYNYALSLRNHCREAGVGFCALVKRKAESDVLDELDGSPVFHRGIHDTSEENPYPQEWGGLRATYDFLGSNDQFARDLEAGIRGRASTGDVIFLPNATPRQILGVALLLKKSPIYRLLRFVLMLRYSVNLASGPINARKNNLDKETAEQYAFSLEKLMSTAPAGSVRLTTDSQELAKEYRALAKRPVEVLPIPHTSNEGLGAPTAGVPTKNKSKLRIVFLGDARDEKGFELLPAVAKACSQEPWLSRVELVFHAYVSSHYHLKMGMVIEEMSKTKARNLQLVTSSLGAEAYHYLLASADLVLLPYDALTYRSRTSGPFVEAICSGKPVVVPAQSWMSTQLGNSGAGKTFVSGNATDLVNAVLAVLQDPARYAKAAEEFGRTFREYHNPANFVRELLKF